MIKKVKIIVYELYRLGKVKFNYVCDRIIDACNLVLMDIHTVSIPGLKKLLHVFARSMGDICVFLRSFPRLSAYELIGTDWSIVVVGGTKNLKEARRLFFQQEPTVRELCRVPIWRLSKCANNWFLQGIDLVICELGSLHLNRPQAPIMFTAPIWVNQIIQLPASLKDLLYGSRIRRIRHLINRANKEKWKYKFSKSKTDFHNFYHHMYLPFITARHDELALVSSHEHHQKRWLRKGGLVLVKKDNKAIAGILCYVSHGTGYAIEEGILEANFHLYRRGISTFMIWSAISWAYSQGARVFNMGGTHGWRSNGLFIFKKNWGAKVVKRRMIYQSWTVLANTLSPKLRDYLNSIGFIAEHKGKLYAVALEHHKNTLDTEALEVMLTEVKKQGLNGILVQSGNYQSRIIK